MIDKARTKIAFLGLGVMGYPMAGHLARAGYSVTVYNRTTSKAEAWVENMAAHWVRPRRKLPLAPKW